MKRTIFFLSITSLFFTFTVHAENHGKIDSAFHVKGQTSLVKVKKKNKIKVKTSLIDFGSVQIGALKSRSIRIRNLSNRKVSIKLLLGNDDFLINDKDQSFKLKANKSKKIKLQFLPNKAGASQAHLTLSIGRANKTKTLELTLAGVGNSSNCESNCNDETEQDQIVLLIPGNGNFSSRNLSNIGGSQLETAARFDLSPYTSFKQELNVGLVAFHQSGINRVEFSVDGGPWQEVTEMQLNPDTCSAQEMTPLAQCITEYTAKLRAQDFATSGRIELRAVIYPNAGKPRQLILPLNVNRGDQTELIKYVSPYGSNTSTCGTDAVSACETISYAVNRISAENSGLVDRAKIYLLEGDHSLSELNANTENDYLTIEAAPSSLREDTKIFGSTDKANISKLRFKNVTWRATSFSTEDKYQGYALEFKDVHFKGDGQHAFSGPGYQPWLDPSFPWDAGISFIDCKITDARFGPSTSYLQRNVIIKRIGEDVFRYPYGLFNVLVDTVHPGSTGWHSDLIEISGGYILDNAIFYGLHATDINAQALFTKAAGAALTQFKNSAIVNSVFHKTDSAWVAQFTDNSSIDNVLFLNNTFVNFSFLFRTPLISNLHAEGNIFAKVGGENVEDSWFKNNHYISSDGYGDLTPGTNYTVGAVEFHNQNNRDFSLSLSSALKDSIPSVVASDVAGQQRGQLSSKGAFE
ncbi:MAG: hypothetical protein H6619_03060 [Deltaproteobacteria bacterium]|nr:hypothetical protein [Deltaproteobacteria bacterium]